jgi:hypothetical protein
MRLFVNDIYSGALMYGTEIKLTDAQRRQLERIRREYVENLNEIFIAARANWLPCHAITKAPLQGRPIDLTRAAECSRKAADQWYKANMLWYEAAAKGPQVLTLDQIRWLEAHHIKLEKAFPVETPGNGP